jgi:hypothetical protein
MVLPPATGPNGMNSCFPHTPVEGLKHTSAVVRKNSIQLPSDGFVGTCLRGFLVRKNSIQRFSAQCNIVTFWSAGCRNNNSPATGARLQVGAYSVGAYSDEVDHRHRGFTNRLGHYAQFWLIIVRDCSIIVKGLSLGDPLVQRSKSGSLAR